MAIDQPTIEQSESGTEALSVEQCWDLLQQEEFGRLAYRLVDELHLVPVNYVVDAGHLLVRTAPGSKLLAAALHAEVAFEIDWHDDADAWSVVVHGKLRRLEEIERHRLDDEARQTWLASLTTDVIEILPDSVTGRRFHLSERTPSGSPRTG